MLVTLIHGSSFVILPASDLRRRNKRVFFLKAFPFFCNNLNDRHWNVVYGYTKLLSLLYGKPILPNTKPKSPPPPTIPPSKDTDQDSPSTFGLKVELVETSKTLSLVLIPI